MSIDFQERINDPMVALQIAIQSGLAGAWTALPGIVQSFDPDAVTVTVQPAIQGVVTRPDGSTVAVNLPLLPDVPVMFPRGGGATLTFPVKDGDECLVVFSSRCIDAWWQSGGVQIPMESRMHDLSDGFALVGPMSQARKISGISTSAVQLRSDDGETFFELNPTSQKIRIVAPGGLEVDAPVSEFLQSVKINGLLTFLGGLVGSAASGAAAVITGIVNFIGEVTANGKHIDDTHTHNGVQSGTGNTGDVN